MRRWLVAVLTLTAMAANAAEYPPNEQPLYGGIAKPPAMIEADQHFIDDVLKMGLSRAQGSDKAVETGWTYLRQGDLADAMKRFNQAWLLDPDNGDAFHGFAVAVLERDRDTAKAEAYFKTGEEKRHMPGIYSDYGRLLLLEKRYLEAVLQLEKAVSFSDMGPDARALWAGAYAGEGNLAAACRTVHEITGGLQPAYQKATDALKATCVRNRGD